MRSYVRAWIAILACYAAGLIGSIFVSTQTGGWYDSLAKPWFNPPPWMFAPIWFVLYGCMAAALILIWNKDPNAEQVRGWVPLFFAHLLVNASWTAIFFGFHSILIAFIDLLCLMIAVFLLFFGAIDIDKRAAWLLAPYLAWVCFAASLNGVIWLMN